MKLIKTLDLLARPRGFEPLTLGLEMQGIGYTNDLVLRRFVILLRAYENGLKTRLLVLKNFVRDYNETGINFYLNFVSGFGVVCYGVIFLF